jgi:hypothetical protein
MDVKDHLPLAELQWLERVEKNADRAKRLRIIILGIEGWTAPAVAIAVGLTRRICQRWVRPYNADGLAGLDDRRGREPRLPSNKNKSAGASTPGRRPRTKSVRCTAKTCSGSWPRSFTCFALWPACITCSIGCDIPTCVLDRGISSATRHSFANTPLSVHS